MSVLDTLGLAGLIPVIKIEDANDAVPLCRALTEGGLPVAEITFRTSAAEQAIKNVHEALPEVILGAGTVLTVDQVKRAVDAGAGYIVSPGLNPRVVEYCVSNDIPVLPGCANPSDIELALEFGLKTVKFFPAEALGGLPLIKAMSAPYGDISFVPTGGINEKNVLSYLAFPKVKAIGGSWMAPSDAIKAKDWARITALSAEAVRLMLGLSVKHVGVNSDSPEKALENAKAFAFLTGWSIRETDLAYFTGDGFELMKYPTALGQNGHIAIQTNTLERAVWHLERKGFRFPMEKAVMRDGKIAAMYLDGDIAGFAVHLTQK